MAQYLQTTYTAAQLRQQEEAIQQRITQLEAERQLIRMQYEQQLRAELPRNLVRFVMDEARVSMMVAEESIIAATNNVELAIELAAAQQQTAAAQPQPAQPRRPVLPATGGRYP
jgi:phosphoenolpyruvate carboxylase